MVKWFKDVETLEELKREYYKLAMKFHPDRGGDLETMKAVNAEYDEMFKRVSVFHKNKDGVKYERAANETPEFFKDIIEKLFKMDGLHIDVVGSFIWVGGNTKENKDRLKELGFRWHSRKKLWYLAPADYHKRTKKQFSYDDVCNMFGIQYSANTDSKPNDSKPNDSKPNDSKPNDSKHGNNPNGFKPVLE